MRQIILALLFCLAVPAVHAQEQEEVYSSSGKSMARIKREKKEKEKGFDRDKLIFGGGVILGIGGGVTNLGVTPVVGYRFTDRFSAGVGVGYEYLSVKNATTLIDPATGLQYGYNLKTSIYSGSVWGRFIVWNNLFLQAEPEINSLEVFSQQNNFSVDKERVFVPSMLVGAGLRQPISERVSLVVVGLYDVLQDKRSPYRNRLDFRVGVNVGF